MARTHLPKQPAPPGESATPRRGRAFALATEAKDIARAAFERAGFADPSLVLHWKEIAGPEIARIARPLRFQQKTGVLTLLAEPGSALFLGHDARQLMGRINAYLGPNAVTKLTFVQGALTPLPEPPKPIRPRTAPRTEDPVHAYRGPDTLKAALKCLARWRS